MADDEFMTEHKCFVFSFEDVEVREREFTVVRAGEALPVEPKAFRVLLFLLRNPHKLISKDELLDAVWNETAVSENSLTRSVALLRRVLGDDTREPRYIATVPTVGYRFLCDVQAKEETPAGSVTADPPSSEGVVAAEEGHTSPPPAANRWKRRSLIAAGAGVSLLILAVAAYFVHGAIVNRAGKASGTASASSRMRMVPLTSLPGKAWGPALSPDGKQLAFLWNGANPNRDDLYVELVGAQTPLRLTHTQSGFICCADWSPDGSEIAFGRCDDHGGAVFVVPALGGTERKITDVVCSFLGAGDPKWTADRESLVLADSCSPGAPGGTLVFSLKTGERRCLHAPPSTDMGDWGPALSPDGKTVAFLRTTTGSMGEVYTVPFAGGNPRRLTFDTACGGDLMWIPDGQSIAFNSNRSGLPVLWRVSAQGGLVEKESVYPGIGSFSNDGRRLAYVEWPGRAGGAPETWRGVLSSEGGHIVSQTRVLASGTGDFGTHISPDGEQIVFESSRSGNSEIWRSNLDGSDPVRLTFTTKGWAGTPRWSPDGKWVVFDFRLGDHSEIHTIDTEGRNEHTIVLGGYDNVVPSWSRDGASIYFASNRTGFWQIWNHDLASGRETHITRNGGFAAFESHDAKTIYYSKFEGGGLWKIPVGGGEEEHITDAPHRGYWGHFAVTESGIYLTDTEAEPRPTIMYYDFQTRQAKPILALDKSPVADVASLTASRDGKTLLYEQVELKSSISMVEYLQ
jgi:Tol biopolymer transport system component/DNA-binding winged helix-turn-helix (wHTH) protein